MARSDAREAAGLALVLALVLLILSLPARAAEGDEARAGVLFAEGRKLADGGRYAEACLKFEESLKLDPGVGTSFNLADCHEHIGRTASAWTRFLEVAAATNLVGQLERERVARARAAALEPKLSRLTVEVSAPVEGLVVVRDGAPIADAAWGTPVPVDPGPHVIEARAPGRVPWSSTTEMPGAPGTVVVSVPALELLPAPPPSASATTSSAPNLLERRDTPAPPGVRRRWIPIVGLAAASAAGAVAAILLLDRARDANAEALRQCVGPGNTCRSNEEKTLHDDLVSDVWRDQILAIASAGVGAAALLGAAYLWWRPAHPSASSSAAPRVSSVRVGLPARPWVGAELSFAW